MKTALFLGRFQPFHNGHLSAVKKALKQADKIIIAIGSAQESYTKKNPFTAKERKNMIKSALKQARISPKRYSLVEIKDILKCDKWWVKHVLKTVPKFQIMYTGNKWTKKCFKNVKNIKLKNIKFELNISSTKIRKSFLKGKAWEKLVPKAVAEEIKKIKGIKRIKDIYR